MSYALDYAEGDKDFARWLAAANAYVEGRCFLSIFDLPDYLWRDEYDDDVSPGAAAREAIAKWKREGDLPGWV